MKNSNLIENNIDNLTGLWKTVGASSLSYHKNENLEYSKIENSDWPNKLWLREDISEKNAEKAIETIKANSGLVIPYFDIYNSNSNKILEAKGLVVKSEQVAMALKLDQKFTLENNLDFKRITTEEEAGIWATLYPSAFGYVIGKEVLVQNHTKVHFYLVSLDKQPIGTLMLYQTENFAGIHGVGVIPEMRRKGFAEEIMKFALNLSIDLKAEYALLQASAMGKDIYTRLGFVDLFVIKNYILG